MDSNLISIPVTTTIAIATNFEMGTDHASHATEPALVPNPTDQTTAQQPRPSLSTPPFPALTGTTTSMLVGRGRAQILTTAIFARPLRPGSWRVRLVARKLWMAEEERERARVGMVGAQV